MTPDQQLVLMIQNLTHSMKESQTIRGASGDYSLKSSLEKAIIRLTNKIAVDEEPRE